MYGQMVIPLRATIKHNTNISYRRTVYVYFYTDTDRYRYWTNNKNLETMLTLSKVLTQGLRGWDIRLL